MTPEERNLITGLFTRLKSADSPQKDQEAEQLIQQSTSAQPTAPYLLVQTVLVQEHALSNAQARIQQLEKQVAEASATASQQGPHKEGGVGGFLSGLFGGHAADQGSTGQSQPAGQQGGTVPPQRLPQAPAQGYAQQAPAQGYAQPTPPPYPSTVGMQPSAGGSFLKSALGTAAGVAGGAALFSGIESLLGHNSGPFGGGGFGHSGFFGGGGGFGGGGFGGGPEVIENREVVNNYYDERGNEDRGNNSSFLGGQGGTGAQEDNRRDDANTTTNDGGNGGLYSTPPTDDVTDSNGSGSYSTPPTDDDSGNADDGLYSTPPTDDDSGSMDNNYDSGNSDAGGGDSGGGDDTSYV